VTCDFGVSGRVGASNVRIDIELMFVGMISEGRFWEIEGFGEIKAD
jgi:hypothetical protein